ncbi:hypothetical protein DFH09DRAFT_626767 [Mycena vulgaris]|nr:hypothetical protein DFH09DRAFT_626767 [Mycena vulgaris]
MTQNPYGPLTGPPRRELIKNSLHFTTWRSLYPRSQSCIHTGICSSHCGGEGGSNKTQATASRQKKPARPFGSSHPSLLTAARYPQEPTQGHLWLFHPPPFEERGSGSGSSAGSMSDSTAPCPTFALRKWRSADRGFEAGMGGGRCLPKWINTRPMGAPSYQGTSAAISRQEPAARMPISILTRPRAPHPAARNLVSTGPPAGHAQRRL